MNLESMSAADALERQVYGLSPELAIEICNAVIAEAERIISICEQEIEDKSNEL